jgi:uncharacterized membrane protein YhaH (DUF805 family)
MAEFFQEFLSWYLAPWRRIGRGSFNIALVAVTVPGMLLMVLGWGSHAGNFLGPVMNIMDMGHQMEAMNSNVETQGNVADVQRRLESFKDSSMGNIMGTASGKPADDKGVDWSGLLNALLLLGMVPMVAMRLRDMGKTGWVVWMWVVLFNVSVVDSLISSLLGFGIVPMGFLWGVVNFFGYGWLGTAKSKAYVPVHEKVPTTWEPPVAPTAPVAPAATKKTTYLNHDPED